VPIKVKRDGKELELRATLDKRPSDPGLKRSEYQNHLGSDLSNRRSGFPQVLQHDMVIRPRDCGGPVVDLDGRALGINVARAGRVESYAIPAEAVKTLIERLKSPTSPGQATKTETRTRAAAVSVPK
jgi:serine protease Do